jgi:hypothetical protein
MSDLPPHIRNKPIVTIVLPGTHNSGAYSESIPDPKILIDKQDGDFSILKYIYPLAHDLVGNWYQCSSTSLYQQLYRGIRYFDLRFAASDAYAEYMKKRKEAVGETVQGSSTGSSEESLSVYEHLWTVHLLPGVTLEAILGDILAFIAEHPGECMVLNISAIYQVDVKTIADALIGKLKDYIFRWEGECQDHEFPVPDATIESMQQLKRPIILVNDDALRIPEVRNYFFSTLPWTGCWKGIMAREEKEAFLGNWERYHDWNQYDLMYKDCIFESSGDKHPAPGYGGWKIEYTLTPTTEWITRKGFDLFQSKNRCLRGIVKTIYKRKFNATFDNVDGDPNTVRDLAQGLRGYLEPFVTKKLSPKQRSRVSAIAVDFEEISEVVQVAQKLTLERFAHPEPTPEKEES